MKASQIKSALSSLIGSEQSVLVWGSSGLGKSSVIREFADEQDLEIVSLREIGTEVMDLKELLSLLPKEGKGILFLDELYTMPAQMKTFTYELIANRGIGKYSLPESYSIVATESDKNTSEVLPANISNHLIHLQMHADSDEWKKWAFSEGIDERVIAYISYKNEALCSFDASLKADVFASPRSWKSVSDILRSDMDEKLLLEVLAGTIGKELATSFLSFSEAAYKLPDIEGILQDAKAEYPSEEDILHMLSCVLVSFLLKYSNEENLENVLKYIMDLKPEFSMMIVQDLQGSGLSLQESKNFSAWMAKFTDLLV